MDISTTLNKTDKSKKRPSILSIVAGVLFVGLFAAAYMPLNSIPTLKLTDMALSSVKRGDLDLMVSGYGQLKAKQQQFLTSRFQATVEQINHYPGEKVSADTVVLSLFNPQLELQVADAELAAAQQRARLAEQSIEQESQLLERRSLITQLESELTNARLRVEAETVLAAQGIVSQLDFKRSQLLVKQLAERIEIEDQRLSQLKKIHQQRSKIQQDLYQQFSLRLSNAQEQLAQLDIRAGIDGVLQTMEVEVGQAVNSGALLAQVGSDKELKAQLRVQQAEAQAVTLGMEGIVNTYGGEARGKVTRIDPIIVDGRVLVELALEGPLPQNARPELSVEGEILTGALSDVLYINTPQHASPNRSSNLYILAANNEEAMKQEVRFGQLSNNKIEIKQGLSSGQKVIISDLSDLFEHSKIKISQ